MKSDIQLYNQALDYAKDGNWQQALLLLSEAIELNSQDAECYSLLGVCHLGLWSESTAIEHFRTAYNLNPQDPLLQSYIPLLILGRGNPFGVKDSPPSTGSCIKFDPTPFSPTSEAEALPDDGNSTIP